MHKDNFSYFSKFRISKEYLYIRSFFDNGINKIQGGFYSLPKTLDSFLLSYLSDISKCSPFLLSNSLAKDSEQINTQALSLQSTLEAIYSESNVIENENIKIFSTKGNISRFLEQLYYTINYIKGLSDALSPFTCTLKKIGSITQKLSNDINKLYTSYNGIILYELISGDSKLSTSMLSTEDNIYQNEGLSYNFKNLAHNTLELGKILSEYATNINLLGETFILLGNDLSEIQCIINTINISDFSPFILN